MIEVYLLGQFDVKRDQESIEIPSRPAQSLLAYLILSAGTAHRREKLAGLLWPDATESNARSNLRHALWRLRKAIGDGYILSDKISIEFDGESDYWLDTTELEGEERDRQDVDVLLQSVSVYGGELLPGFYDDWVILERERLRALFEKRIHWLLDLLVELNRWSEVLEWGERWIAMGYVPEPAYRALMVANSGLGDSAGMAAVYRRCINALRDELGVEPSEETQATYEWLAQGGKPGEVRQIEQIPVLEADSATAVQALLGQWRARGVEVLDVPSLAIIQASPGEGPLADGDAALLIRSALEHAVDVEPWLERARSEDVAVEALMDVCDDYPRPRVRTRIVEALEGLPSDAATKALLRIGTSDDTARVRSKAAVAAAERGQLDAVMQSLVGELNETGGAAAMASFVAVADVVGIPEGIGRYPRLSVGLALAQRRWRANASSIFRQALRAATGGALAMALVANLQLIPGYIMNPDVIQQSLEFMTLPIWLFSNLLLGLLWGGLLGGALGFLVGLADSLWSGSARPKWRVIFGSFAGLIQSMFLILLSLSEGFVPQAASSVFTPIYIVYGLVFGAALTIVVPQLGTRRSRGSQVGRAFLTSALIAVVAIPSVYVVYRDTAITALVLHLMGALFYPLGIALALSGGRVETIET
ncbi:MAG: hypothetical protein GTO18_21860 [Anaerolineales bacterium]|nr:hypothetical protein [Anaerolineales bacterium]